MDGGDPQPGPVPFETSSSLSGLCQFPAVSPGVVISHQPIQTSYWTKNDYNSKPFSWPAQLALDRLPA